MWRGIRFPHLVMSHYMFVIYFIVQSMWSLLGDFHKIVSPHPYSVGGGERCTNELIFINKIFCESRRYILHYVLIYVVTTSSCLFIVYDTISSKGQSRGGLFRKGS